MKYEHYSFWHNLLASRISLLVLVLLIVFIGIAVVKERKSQKIVKEDINSLENEIAELDSRSFELTQMIKYLRSDEYVEREAREKLGMQKQGEQLIIVAENVNSLPVAGDHDLNNKKNWQLWLEYFFGQK
ncbi:hypothetical protein A3B87_01505 [Candidatus Kuenenbacteria bacterium RIFCSPHIGHO2_02_FULL_39_13]|uniref:Cell division protein FtsL n=1 Tax=Candidatus Kuenenbacteria bacterium RIFCSPHIGHO2_02_FULL_39_13 TaxID=1798561 RepID=A0A1F6FL00_9BACT|nr:MAG: hypothetical protein A3B87_01505 [Candidatus Kuenenbacteria bacterium RIFCSPHIGHO2_02_FULL_39_13]